MNNKLTLALLSAFSLYLLTGAPSLAASRLLMGEQADGSVSVPTNQTVTPIGRLKQIEGRRIKDIELSRTEKRSRC
jgi:hypothetical protein